MREARTGSAAVQLVDSESISRQLVVAGKDEDHQDARRADLLLNEDRRSVLVLAYVSLAPSPHPVY